MPRAAFAAGQRLVDPTVMQFVELMFDLVQGGVERDLELRPIGMGIKPVFFHMDDQFTGVTLT